MGHVGLRAADRLTGPGHLTTPGAHRQHPAPRRPARPRSTQTAASAQQLLRALPGGRPWSGRTWPAPLARLRADHTVHAARTGGPRSRAGDGHRPPARPPTCTSAATTAPVVPTAATALSVLAQAERAAAPTASAELAAVDARTARLLASIAACSSAHVALLARLPATPTDRRDGLGDGARRRREGGA